MADNKGMPRKKGGAMFPRIDLKEAVGYAKKLVSKTHTGPQKPAILFPGVFGAKGNRAQIRAAALKQYGLIKGSSKEGFEATQAAKDLVHATEKDVASHRRKAALNPSVFKALYNTFKGDRVTLARIKQQAANLRVHPDNVDSCADLFAGSLVFAGLAAPHGDEYEIGNDITDPFQATTQGDPAEEEDEEGVVDESDVPDDAGGSDPGRGHSAQGRAVIRVNVTLDSSLDTEKLERQLQLLRRYGAL